MAYPKMDSVCAPDKGARPGRPTNGRMVPANASARRAAARVWLGFVAQNQRRSLADTMEKTAN